MRVSVIQVRLAIVLLAAAPAAAGTLPGGATITFDRLVAPSSDAEHYFNLAHCACSQAMPAFAESAFTYAISLHDEATPVHVPLDIWVGAGCDDPAMRAAQCHAIASAQIPDLHAIGGGASVVVPVYDLMEPEPMQAGCDARALDATEWAIADGNGDGTPDYFVSQAIATDALPPPLPTDFAVTGTAGGLEISWTPPADTSDLAAYQALCTTDLGNPATDRPHAARYTTGRMLCGVSLDVPLHPSPISFAGDDGADAATDVSLSQGLAQLDPSLLCGDTADPSATHLVLDPPTRDRPLIVVLVAIDHAGNAAATYFTRPLPSRTSSDFWQDLHDRGGGAHGGFCLIADTFGDHHPLTDVLRAFRDDTLSATAPGRWLARAYDTALRPLGRIVRIHWMLRLVAAILLAPVILVALAWHFLTLPGCALLVIGCRMLRRSRRESRQALQALDAVVLTS